MMPDHDAARRGEKPGHCGEGRIVSVSDSRKAAEDERERLLKIDRWTAAYKDALAQEPLLVAGNAPEKVYYIVEFRQGNRTTGLMLVNARSGKVGSVTGIQTAAASMFHFYQPKEIPALVDECAVLFPRPNDLPPVTMNRVVLNVQALEVQPTLYWEPCDQSLTLFQPFYVVYHRELSQRDRLFVRVDGEIYTSITHGGAGM